jgi:hypothetical protein
MASLSPEMEVRTSELLAGKCTSRAGREAADELLRKRNQKVCGIANFHGPLVPFAAGFGCGQSVDVPDRLAGW